MALVVYNTATRRKEVFTPLEEGRVRMYVCGITPYAEAHVGHGRSYVAFDVIRRALEYLGYEVRYVQNFTDVDDKIIARAREMGVEPLELSARYAEEFLEEMRMLNVKKADSYPKVSEMIGEIIGVVEALVEKGAAYEVDGSVYLDVSRVNGYGRLSGMPLEELKAGARVEVDERKRSPLDFALWKPAKQGELSWHSPWGEGRPGWHIECSVMSMKTLGPTIDIHGGGQDLIFPHHENEIAQSEAYTGKPFVRYWLHNGLVTVEGEKMSKSLGNVVSLKEVLKRHDPQALRFFLLSAHYRSHLDFSERAVADAEKAVERLKASLHNVRNAFQWASDGVDSFRERAARARVDFTAALEDDFNVPRALAALFDFVRDVNTYITSEPTAQGLSAAEETLKELTRVLGLRIEEELPERVIALVELLLKLRSQLRARGDYELSDRIRAELRELGIAVEDRGERSFWRFA